MPSSAPPKLNLFVLPSLTNLLFLIIAVVLGIPILLSGGSASFMLVPLLPLGVALLTLWDFLRQPDVERRRWKMAPLPAEHAWLNNRIDALAREAGLDRPPRLFAASSELDGPFAFGTWRRRYLAFPGWLLREMTQTAARTHTDQSEAIDAVLRHELAHFANQDVWRALLARSLLKMTVIFLAANWLAMLWLPFAYELLRQGIGDWTAILPAPLLGLFPAEIQQFIGQPPALAGVDILVMETMIGVALWPLILGALLLWRTTWNSLLRVREQIADARAAAWLRSAAPLGRAMQWLNLVVALPREDDPQVSRWDRLRQLPVVRSVAPPLAWPGTALVEHWLSPQPAPQLRHLTLAQPERVYGTAGAIGRQAGLAVLLLYLLMASIFAPAGRGVNSELVAGFGFILLALGLTPMALGGDRRALLRWVAEAVAIYSLLFCIASLVMFVLAALVLAWQPRALDMTLYAGAMVAPRGNLDVIVDDPTGWLIQAVIGATVTFVVGLPALVFSFVLADLALKRQALTWYGAPLLQRRPKLLFLGATALAALVLWLGAVPMLNLLAFPTIFEPDGAFWLRIGLAALLAVAAFGAGLAMHARYAHRCPGCSGHIPGPYTLGRCCPTCGQALNPWLVASY